MSRYVCKNCGSFVSQNAEVCKRCGTENPAVIREPKIEQPECVVIEDKPQINYKYVFWAAVIIIAIIIGAVSGKKSGDEITINRNCFGATIKAYFEEMVHTAVSHDEIGILDLMYSGKIRNINAGTRGKLLEDCGTSYRVRLYDDNSAWYISCDDVE